MASALRPSDSTADTATGNSPADPSAAPMVGLRTIVRRRELASRPKPGHVARRMIGLGRQLGMRSNDRSDVRVRRLPEVRFPAGVWAMPTAEPEADTTASAADPVMAAIRARYKPQAQRRYEPPKRGLPSAIRRGALTKAGTSTGPAAVMQRIAPSDAPVAANDGHFSPSPKRAAKASKSKGSSDDPGPRGEPAAAPSWTAARAAEAFTQRLADRTTTPDATSSATSTMSKPMGARRSIRRAATRARGVVASRSERMPARVTRAREHEARQSAPGALATSNVVASDAFGSSNRSPMPRPDDAPRATSAVASTGLPITTPPATASLPGAAAASIARRIAVPATHRALVMPPMVAPPLAAHSSSLPDTATAHGTQRRRPERTKVARLVNRLPARVAKASALGPERLGAVPTSGPTLRRPKVTRPPARVAQAVAPDANRPAGAVIDRRTIEPAASIPPAVRRRTVVAPVSNATTAPTDTTTPDDTTTPTNATTPATTGEAATARRRIAPVLHRATQARRSPARIGHSQVGERAVGSLPTAVTTGTDIPSSSLPVTSAAPSPSVRRTIFERPVASENTRPLVPRVARTGVAAHANPIKDDRARPINDAALRRSTERLNAEPPNAEPPDAGRPPTDRSVAQRSTADTSMADSRPNTPAHVRSIREMRRTVVPHLPARERLSHPMPVIRRRTSISRQVLGTDLRRAAARPLATPAHLMSPGAPLLRSVISPPIDGTTSPTLRAGVPPRPLPRATSATPSAQRTTTAVSPKAPATKLGASAATGLERTAAPERAAATQPGVSAASLSSTSAPAVLAARRADLGRAHEPAAPVATRGTTSTSPSRHRPNLVKSTALTPPLQSISRTALGTTIARLPSSKTPTTTGFDPTAPPAVRGVDVAHRQPAFAPTVRRQKDNASMPPGPLPPFIPTTSARLGDSSARRSMRPGEFGSSLRGESAAVATTDAASTNPGRASASQPASEPTIARKERPARKATVVSRSASRSPSRSASRTTANRSTSSAQPVQREATGHAGWTATAAPGVVSRTATQSASQPASNTSVASSQDRETVTDRLDRIDEIVSLVEARVLADLERRGGRHRGWI
jgi:hypothetical protein